MIIDLEQHRAEAKRKARLDSPEPYCGPCLEQTGDINDLIAYKVYGGPDRLMCAQCGEDFEGDIIWHK